MTKATDPWHVEVDRDRCMATAACVHALPGVFALGDDGLAAVIGPVDGDDDFLRDVVAECPTAALRLVRGDLSAAAGERSSRGPSGPDRSDHAVGRLADGNTSEEITQ